jgi:hypothetical protein
MRGNSTLFLASAGAPVSKSAVMDMNGGRNDNSRRLVQEDCRYRRSELFRDNT